VSEQSSADALRRRAPGLRAQRGFRGASANLPGRLRSPPRTPARRALRLRPRPTCT